MERELLGYILSGATTEEAYFQPLEQAEQVLREGMMVVIGDDNPYYAVVSRLEARSELYEPGDAWLESLRRGFKPPDQLSRSYLLAQLRILGRLRGGELLSPDQPPRPGDPVYKAGRRDASAMYGFSLDTPPERYIAIGGFYGYSLEELPALLDLSAVTMHIAVIGVTGSGKSNTVGVIVEELGGKNSIGSYRTLPAFIIDANGDYLDYYHDPSLVPAYTKVYRMVFPGSEASSSPPPPSHRSIQEPILVDLNVFEPDELAELITAYYQAGRIDGAEKQAQLLQDTLLAFKRGVAAPAGCTGHDGVDYDCLLGTEEGVELLEAQLEESSIDYHPATIAAARRAVRLFHRRFSTEIPIVPPSRRRARLDNSFIDRVTDPQAPSLVILDFSAEGATSVPLDAKQLVVYYLLRLLFQAFTSYRIRGLNRLALFVIEEAQNYAPNLSTYPVGFSLARRILATVATQGRKFGLSLVLVTQRPSYVDPVVMSMMNTFIIHRVAPRDASYVDQVSGGLPPYIAKKLPALERGLAVIAGQMNPLPVPVLTRIRKRRSHRIGGEPLL
ncbi:MAG: ATP-binding protein [Pyrodictiaceae archaeon]